MKFWQMFYFEIVVDYYRANIFYFEIVVDYYRANILCNRSVDLIFTSFCTNAKAGVFPLP